MKVLCLAFAVLFLLSSCYSVPRVDGAIQIEEGKYQIKMDRDYLNQPDEFKYAINSFVKEQGETTYDLELDRRGPIYDVYVIMPGSQPIENLPPIKHFHKGKTLAAILIPTVVVGATMLILLPSLL